MSILVVILAALVLVATLLPILRHEAWWIRIFDFPRLQIITAGAVTLFGLVVFDGPGLLHEIMATALVVALGHHVYRVLPFSPLWRKQVRAVRSDASPGDTVSVLVANVLMENRDSEALFRIIDEVDPDIILAVETDEWWTQRFRRYETSHPYVHLEPQPNTYGMVLMSRLETDGVRLRRLVQDDVPSVLAAFRVPSGREFTFFGLHPRPPHPRYSTDTTPRDAELLIIAREVAEIDGPVIVAGDLNDVAWSHTTRLFQRISGLVDPRRGRGMFNTFHAGKWFARWPLDHIFHSACFGLVDLERLPAFGSDHFPVLARLHLGPPRSPDVASPAADQRDLAEARRKIRSATDDEPQTR